MTWGFNCIVMNLSKFIIIPISMFLTLSINSNIMSLLSCFSLAHNNGLDVVESNIKILIYYS